MHFSSRQRFPRPLPQDITTTGVAIYSIQYGVSLQRSATEPATAPAMIVPMPVAAREDSAENINKKCSVDLPGVGERRLTKAEKLCAGIDVRRKPLAPSAATLESVDAAGVYSSCAHAAIRAPA